MTCALCGHRYDASANPGCARCPLVPSCRTICCPACGYQTVGDSAIWLALRRLVPQGLRRRPAAKRGTP